ncbi:unnamed protein product [Ixodes hexagonus]
MSGLRRKEPWALRLISSNGLLSNSMFEYNLANVGGYEQCLRTVARGSDQSVKFRGLYCSLHLRVPKPFSKGLVERFSAIGEMTGRFNLSALPDTIRSRDVAFRFSMCAPSTCSQEELHSLVWAGMYRSKCSFKHSAMVQKNRSQTVPSLWQAFPMSSEILTDNIICQETALLISLRGRCQVSSAEEFDVRYLCSHVGRFAHRDSSRDCFERISIALAFLFFLEMIFLIAVEIEHGWSSSLTNSRSHMFSRFLKTNNNLRFQLFLQKQVGVVISNNMLLLDLEISEKVISMKCILVVHAIVGNFKAQLRLCEK